MRTHRQLLHWAGVLLGALVVLTGCTYDAAVRQLSAAEQSELKAIVDSTYGDIVIGKS